MAGSSSNSQRLVDTVALAALGQSSYEDEVFSSVSITVTRCCFQELQRGAEDGNSLSYRTGCQTALEKIRSRGDNIDLLSTGLRCRDDHGYLKENIGERSIARALENNPSFTVVVSFDDDVIDGSGAIGDEMKQMFRQTIPQFIVAPANEPLYRLYVAGEINEDDFVQGTQRMIREMGWSDSATVDLFWDTYDESFDR